MTSLSVTVHVPFSGAYPINTLSTTTARSLCETVIRASNNTFDSPCVVYRGRVLADERTLGDEGVSNGAVLHLMRRPEREGPRMHVGEITVEHVEGNMHTHYYTYGPHPEQSRERNETHAFFIHRDGDSVSSFQDFYDALHYCLTSLGTSQSTAARVANVTAGLALEGRGGWTTLENAWGETGRAMDRLGMGSMGDMPRGEGWREAGETAVQTMLPRLGEALRNMGQEIERGDQSDRGDFVQRMNALNGMLSSTNALIGSLMSRESEGRGDRRFGPVITTMQVERERHGFGFVGEEGSSERTGGEGNERERDGGQRETGRGEDGTDGEGFYREHEEDEMNDDEEVVRTDEEKKRNGDFVVRLVAYYMQSLCGLETTGMEYADGSDADGALNVFGEERGPPENMLLRVLQEVMKKLKPEEFDKVLRGDFEVMYRVDLWGIVDAAMCGGGREHVKHHVVDQISDEIHAFIHDIEDAIGINDLCDRLMRIIHMHIVEFVHIGPDEWAGWMKNGLRRVLRGWDWETGIRKALNKVGERVFGDVGVVLPLVWNLFSERVRQILNAPRSRNAQPRQNEGVHGEDLPPLIDDDSVTSNTLTDSDTQTETDTEELYSESESESESEPTISIYDMDVELDDADLDLIAQELADETMEDLDSLAREIAEEQPAQKPAPKRMQMPSGLAASMAAPGLAGLSGMRTAPRATFAAARASAASRDEFDNVLGGQDAARWRQVVNNDAARMRGRTYGPLSHAYQFKQSAVAPLDVDTAAGFGVEDARAACREAGVSESVSRAVEATVAEHGEAYLREMEGMIGSRLRSDGEFDVERFPHAASRFN